KIDGYKNYRGFYVLDRHCNSMGIAHGGLLVSFADALLGLAVFRKTRGAPMTVRLTTDFMSTAKRGDWVEGQGSVTGLANDVVYVNALVYVAERTILTAQGIFRAQKREMDG
ncbi:PaaI family thioesterase, partial [Marinobacter alexandrii]|uniref:PaaI family thioesterase n=1 Tax=Marinobacter alexandrii TaxID=2570351 RepID=UPI00329842EE